MEVVSFKEMQKKDRLIVVKISKAEKDRLFEFCHKKGVTVSDLIRHSLRKVINEKNQ